MSERCSVLPEGSTCQSIFDEFLSLEFTNSEYGKVHYLTITCFMLQHGRYSDEAFVWARSILRTYLDEQLTPQQLRQHAAQETNRANRKWKVIRQADAPPLPKVAWSMTIADVVPGVQDPEQYCERIQQWARTTLQHAEEVQL